ncbi:hypothetical protein CP8484711_0523, partial [Chlamydia psittaci 84-8471/1]
NREIPEIAASCTGKHAPLNVVNSKRSQSRITGRPSLYLRSLGTTFHPKRTPEKPKDLEKEFTSIAQERASGISKMLFGKVGSEINAL